MGDSGSGRAGASLPNETSWETMDLDGPGCVWCEQVVADYGDVCSVDCWSLLFAYLLRNAIDGVAVADEFPVMAKPLEQQPWYEGYVGIENRR